MEIKSKDLEKETEGLTAEQFVQKMPASETPIHKVKETILHREDDKGYYNECIFSYAKQFPSVQVFSMLREAFGERLRGNKALSYRELDVCERRGLDLDNNGFLWEALFEFNGIITEGYEYTKVNPYEKRKHYNKGVDWRRDKRPHLQNQEAIEKGDQLLIDIQETLAGLGLPLRSDEIENGFPLEMCRPEYLDFGQYEKSWKRMKATNAYQKIVDTAKMEVVQ